MRTQILGLGALLLALQACSDDPAANDGKPTIDGSAAASLDCASLIPAAAIDALGWPAVEPEEHAGRCLVRSARGEVTVGTRAVPASADERADAVQAELETQCERLRADGRQFVGEPEWLAEGHQGCLTQVDPRTGTGSRSWSSSTTSTRSSRSGSRRPDASTRTASPTRWSRSPRRAPGSANPEAPGPVAIDLTAGRVTVRVKEPHAWGRGRRSRGAVS